MKTIYFFIAGMGAALSFGWPSKMKYPFGSSAKTIGGDWINIGNDLKRAINKLEKTNEAQK